MMVVSRRHSLPQAFQMPSQQQTLQEASVVLHVYDLGGAAWSSANHLLKSLGTGAFHTAIEVHGVEWSFGGLQGVRSGTPGADPRYIHRESIEMGTTALSPSQVKTAIEKMRHTWVKQRYDALRNNCNHFAESLLAELGVEGEVPAWVSSLAGVGAALDDVGLMTVLVAPFRRHSI